MNEKITRLKFHGSGGHIYLASHCILGAYYVANPQNKLIKWKVTEKINEPTIWNGIQSSSPISTTC